MALNFGRRFDSWPPRYRVHPWASRSIECASLTKQHKFGTGASWEGNRRSSVALAVCGRHGDISTYGLTALERKMSTPRLCVFEVGHTLPFIFCADVQKSVDDHREHVMR